MSINACRMSFLCLTSILYCSLLSLSGCGATTGPISGQVIHESSKAPVAGAVVVALWFATNETLFNSSTICYHTSTAITDANGRFTLEKWHNAISEGGGWATDQRVKIGAYKQGMALDYQNLEDAKNTTIKLHPYTYPIESRLYYLSRISGGYCTQHDKESRKSAVLLMQEAYKEMNELKTKDTAQEYILKDFKKEIKNMQDQ